MTENNHALNKSGATADSGMHRTLLPQLRLPLLHGSDEHGADSGTRQSAVSTTNTTDGYHVEVLGTSVIRAVDHCTNGQTYCGAELVAHCSGASWSKMDAA